MTSTSAPAPLTGVIPPLLTPLTADGQLDRPSLERLVTRLLEAGVDGIFALGSSGEIAFFDDAQRAEVLEAVTGTVAGQVPVIAEIGRASCRESVESTEAGGAWKRQRELP